MDLTDTQLDRYARHIILKEVGGEGQKTLLKAKVLVIGAGGLGSPLILYLAAAGVGTIGVVDDDVVSLSNLQRQVLYKTTDVGSAKTFVTEKAIKALNVDVNLVCHQIRITETNAASLLTDYDLVADGCDNFETRLIVSDACVAAKKTLVSGAISQFEGQLASFNPHTRDKSGSPLPCYRCFVPSNPGDGPESDNETSCAHQGVLGAIAGVVGTLQAVEVLKEILSLGDTLMGKLMLYDALGAQTRVLKLPKDPDCPGCGGINPK